LIDHGIGEVQQAGVKAKRPAGRDFFTMMCAGYSSGGSRSGYGRGEGRYFEAGVSCPSRSCGRSVLSS
jgi:hypothetical protein